MTSNLDIPGLRLHSQHIVGPRCADAAGVLRRLGAVQAQDYGQALWALGARIQHATIKSVEQAIGEGLILRTWPMRGTIHFVPAEDAGWMLRLCAERMLARDARRLQQLELDHAVIERCAALFVAALSGGKQLPRSELMALLEQAGIATGQQRGYHILWHLAQRGLLCIGPMHGKEQSFVLLDEWAPQPRMLEGEAALAELARRYVVGHGPATVHDFAWWSGITIGEAKTGLAGAGQALDQTQHNGKTYWIARDAAEASQPAAGVYLLPGFDEFMLGYRDRGAVLDAQYANQVVPGNNGIFMPIIVVDGCIAGTWKRAIKRQSLDITLRPFTDSAELAERAAQAALRYCEFLGLPLASLDVGPAAA